MYSLRRKGSRLASYDVTRCTWQAKSARSKDPRLVSTCLAAAHCCNEQSATAALADRPSCTIREERIEKAGPLGKAQVLNRELQGVEAQLREGAANGEQDAFTSYLLGLVMSDM